MVRAGVVRHPGDWEWSGYREIQNPPKRYGIIDLRELSSLCGFHEVAELQNAHRGWVDQALGHEKLREARWSEAIAVGSLNFIEKVKSELGFKAIHREVIAQDGAHALREEGEPYGPNFDGKNESLSFGNSRFWNEDEESTVT